MKFKKQGQFLLGIFAIYGFIFYFVPLLTQNATSQQMIQFIEAKDIDAGALFYTESEEATKAEFLMRRDKRNR